MSDNLLLEQYCRLLADASAAGDPWPVLESSGFLEMLSDPAGEQTMADLFPLIVETGRRPSAPPVIEAIVARPFGVFARSSDDLEACLVTAGVDAARARTVAAGVSAGLMAGTIVGLRDMTIEYALLRRQFGREIAKFQAIQQQIAVLAEETQAALAAAGRALAGHPADLDANRVAIAKIRVGEAAAVAASIAHAVHGAIGISLEHPLHLYTGRLHRGRLMHGGESWWAERLGAWALADDGDFAALARRV